MISSSKLLKKLEQLIAESLPNTSNEDGEVVFTLHQTNWLRILVVRHIKEPKVFSIEVETSIPKEAPDKKSVPYESNNEEMNGKLEIMIDHLRYIQRLQSEGFTLDIIRQDCLWSASKEFTKTPSKSLIKLLLPPRLESP